MKQMNLFYIIKKNFSKRVIRHGILIICVATAVAIQISTSLIEKSSQRGLELGLQKMGADLIAVPKGLEQKLIKSYLSGEPSQFYMNRSLKDKLSSFSYVEKVSAQLYIQSLYRASCCSVSQVFLVGFEPEFDFTIKPWLQKNNKDKIKNDEIIIGAGIEYGNGKSLNFYGQKFKVAGVLNFSNMGLDSSIFIPLESAYKMAEESKSKAEKKIDVNSNMISAVLIKLKDEDDGGIPGWKAAHLIEKEIPRVSIIKPSDMTTKVKKNLSGVLKNLRSTIYVILPLTVLLIGLIFAMSANERKREIGLYRAMGATRSFIFRLIILESFIIAVMGMTIGIILSFGAVYGFSGSISHRLEIPFHLPDFIEIWSIMITAAFLAVGTCILSASIPAYNASTMEIYESIRTGDL